jgi:hypothetical protein
MRGIPAILDRIEGQTAVLEIEGRETPVPAAWLPPDTREGDVLSVRIRRAEGESRIQIQRDPEATRRAREEAERLLRRLRLP